MPRQKLQPTCRRWATVVPAWSQTPRPRNVAIVYNDTTNHGHTVAAGKTNRCRRQSVRERSMLTWRLAGSCALQDEPKLPQLGKTIFGSFRIYVRLGSQLESIMHSSHVHEFYKKELISHRMRGSNAWACTAMCLFCSWCQLVYHAVLRFPVKFSILALFLFSFFCISADIWLQVGFLLLLLKRKTNETVV